MNFVLRTTNLAINIKLPILQMFNWAELL